MSSLLVTHTGHFVRTPDDTVYSLDAPVDHTFFARYLTVFDRVTVAARVRTVSQVSSHWRRANGEAIGFCNLPDYLGPWQYIRCLRQIDAKLADAIANNDAYCLRVPCAIATRAWRLIRRRNRCFGLEVCGDPWDSLSGSSYRSIIRPVARRLAARDLYRQVRSAEAVAYVTQNMLQRRYPPARDVYTTHYSSIELPDDVIRDQPRSIKEPASRLVFVGSLEVLYKAPDLLLRALARINRPALTLTIVGEGRERRDLEQLANRLGIADQVEFTGRLEAGAAVRDRLDAADLFVLPSRTEGLPRAMIEAMARGLPCIGTTAGGIVELLPPQDRVPSGDLDALTRIISEFLDDPDRLDAAGRRNLQTARQYRASLLTARRTNFYEYLDRHCASQHG